MNDSTDSKGRIAVPAAVPGIANAPGNSPRGSRG
jgi:hypothetical protein